MLGEIKVLDKGYVKLLNVAGPYRRQEKPCDGDDTDFAKVARISYQGDDDSHTREQDLKLADYLIKNKHTTPIEMIETWWEVKLPLFVARQLIRHRTISVNEMSARYTVMPDEFYIPEPINVGVQHETNKQGSNLVGVARENMEYAEAFCGHLEEHSRHSYEMYEIALKAGVPRERARCFLPVNVYTRWIWKQDLWNLMHFLRLRLHSHAQFESRLYAEAKFELLKLYLPESCTMFDKHIRVKED